MKKRRKKLNLCDLSHGIDLSEDFHALDRSQVEKVSAAAKLYGYRKSKSAPGSKARMFFQLMQRRCAR